MAAQEEAEVKSIDSKKSESETSKNPHVPRPKHENRVSHEEGDMRKSSESPLHPRRASRQSVGSDRSIENSPMHPHQQARVGNKNSAGSSPMWERKSEGSHSAAPLTPGRSRLRQVTRGDETPDDSPVVPKFGDWDDNDPASAEGFTHIFDKVREDKHNGGGKSPMITTENSHFYGQNRRANENAKVCGCFPWGRK